MGHQPPLAGTEPPDRVREEMRAFYRHARGYQEQTSSHDSSYFDRYRRTLRQWLPDTPVDVLELGAGEALLPLAKEGRLRRVVAMELADDHLRAIQAHGDPFRAVGGDALSLPFRESSFDVITSFQVIEHLPGIETMLDEAFRVLRRPGWFVVGMPNHASLWTPLEDFLRGRTRHAFGVAGRWGALRWWWRNARLMATKRLRASADFHYQVPVIDGRARGGDRDAVYYACPLDMMKAMKARDASAVGTDAYLRWGRLGEMVPTELRGSIVAVWRI